MFKKLFDKLFNRRPYAVSVASFKYTDGEVPDGYKCGNCGKTGVRLYRDYNTFLEYQHLTCRSCTIKENGEPSEYSGPEEHTIGYTVAAVPTEDGRTYWGYTSVPPEGVEWWNNLPR